MVNIHIIWKWGTFVQPLLKLKRIKYYIFCMCVCSISYLACNDRVLYCHMAPVRLHNIFPHYLVNGMIPVNTSYCWVRYYQKCMLSFQQGSCFSCQKLVFLTDFLKDTIIKLHENPSIGCWIVPCRHRQIDRQTARIKLIFAFHNFVKAPNSHCHTT
jgi:hypothetical protein